MTSGWTSAAKRASAACDFRRDNQQLVHLGAGEGRLVEALDDYVFVDMSWHMSWHVNPSLPLARELVGRGERVIYFNDAEFSRAVSEGSGAEFRPVSTWNRDLSDDRSGNADR